MTLFHHLPRRLHTLWNVSLSIILLVIVTAAILHRKEQHFMVEAWSSVLQTLHQQQQDQHRQHSCLHRQTPISSSTSRSPLSSWSSLSSVTSPNGFHRRKRFPHLRHPHLQENTQLRRPPISSTSSLVPTTILHSSSQQRQQQERAQQQNDNERHQSSSSNNNKRTPGDFPPLMLFDSKTRTKQVFHPLASSGGKSQSVSMYTCGPTVYDYAHIGNFRAFLTYDLIKRVLMYLGYDVTHICNLTDIDDKIIARANAQKIPQGQIFTDMLTRKYERYFFDDLAALNVVLADRYPRAAEHIPEMMDMILALEANGLAYEADDGSWYFATSAKDGYGQQLINLNRDEMEMTEDTDSKRDPQDFALWKAFKPGVDRDDASWESDRFKRGRPGWHLECSAMARKYLGDTIDIHGGGIDLKFPHHENEIAQSEGVTGQTFCNCWLHNGFVNINDEKMSKSLGNFLTLRTACPTSQDVRAYRYLVMSSQYSKQLNFTPQAMDASKSSLKRIDKVMNEVEQLLAASADDRSSDNDSDIVSDVVPKALSNFEAALLDDLSMPRASASLFSLIKAAEKELKRVVKEGDSATPDFAGLKSIVDAIRQMDEIFGIFYDVPLTDEEEKERAAKRSKGDDDDGSDLAPDSIPSEVMQLVMRRSEAKEAKDWELADSLRTRITELGFAVKDVKGGEPVVTRVEQ